jgi:hypothetical protein
VCLALLLPQADESRAITPRHHGRCPGWDCICPTPHLLSTPTVTHLPSQGAEDLAWPAFPMIPRHRPASAGTR